VKENKMKTLKLKTLNNRAKKHIKSTINFYEIFDQHREELLTFSWNDLVNPLQTLSSQKSSPFIEKKIILDHKLTRHNILDKGDAYYHKNTKKIFEIKHSFVKPGDKANLVQIRPWQKVGYLIYIFDLADDVLFKFEISRAQMHKELKSLGSSAHGTKAANAENKNKERAIRISLLSEDFQRWINEYKPKTLSLK